MLIGELDRTKRRCTDGEAPSPTSTGRYDMRRAKITVRGAVVADSFAIADPDYLYAAKIVIEHYGRGAASHCAKRANHLLRIGDMDGNTVWRRILAAIEELQRGRREGEAAN